MTLRSEAYETRRLELMAAQVCGKNVLDVGYAKLPNPFLGQFYCVGLDLNKPKQPSPYHEEIAGDVTDIGGVLAGRSFDTILCGELIEHLENPVRFLRDLSGLLSENGRIVLSTPNPLGFPIVFCEILGSRRYFYSPDHVALYSPRWIARLARRAKLEVCSVKPVGLWLGKFALPFCPVPLSYQVIYVLRKVPN